MSRSIVLATGVGLIVAACATTAAAGGESAGRVDFNRQVRPILSNNCFACHGPDDGSREADLRLDTAEGAEAVVTPGAPEGSELVRRITADEDERMPPVDSGKALSPAEIEILRQWVAAGAKYAQHWSYVKPARPPLPEVADPSWPRNPIDHFVLARLDREGLRPSPEADRHALVRRLSLAITGLPPTIEEVNEFLADETPDAVERLVDRLLAKEAYGEHWGRMWLDLARYADSGGYVSDDPRQIWAYRDWVIRAFNTNQPFDQFTIEQIAGDLVPQPTEQQLIATAFHRNTPTNTEGGTDDEEFRNVAVVDRVNTTMAVWMGTTMACAQCHTHKYDPISQEEYFRFFAIFNNTEDADRPDEQPVHALFTVEERAKRARIEGEIAEQEAKIAAMPAETAAKEIETERERLKKLQTERDGIKGNTVPIMRELPADGRRVTHLQYRGNFMDLGPQVTEGVPAAFHPLPADVPPNRLALAKWLVDPENPLTARVTVNRCWQTFFGTGLVATSDDFGMQGDLPTHPELLDWLAVEFIESQWDLKHLVKLITTSATYRQSSRVAPESADRDPDNRLLARGPRFRLDAEVIRDQALAAAGLLSATMYGPPVRPPQPSFGLSAAFGGKMDWETSAGEDRYRRGLYTLWRRTNPYPSMTTFDAPNREICTVRRSRTNTPLQALVTLNDPVYVEAAQGLARRMIRDGGSQAADRIGYGFRRCLARPPSDAEIDRLAQLYEKARQRFAAAPQQAEKMATVPLGPAAEFDIVELAAWTVVANVLLNLDEMFMSR